jgi:hypothetical protein
MTTSEKLETLYKQLNAPSAKAFHRALALQGITTRLKDIREFVESKSERQILAPPPKYTGRVVANDIDDLWMADLIAFTSRPAKRRNFERLRTAEKSYTHVLVVIDVFSRQIWTKPLQSTSQTTEAFKAILQNGRTPRRLDTDGGTEWSAAVFRALCASNKIEHVIKDPDDQRGIATVDAAIGSLKRDIRRRQEQDGGSWLDHLEEATAGHNERPHSATNAVPNAMSDSNIFSERKKARENMEHNMRGTDTRKQQLKQAGGFRTHIPRKTGLKRRVDQAAWSKDIKEVKGFPAPGLVEDSKGGTYRTKLVKAVPLDSSKQAQPPPPKATVVDSLRPFAKALQALLGRGRVPGAALRMLKTRKSGITDALNVSSLSFNAFVDKFPDLITRRAGKLYPTNQGTL